MSERDGEANEPDEIWWGHETKYNRPHDWENTITIPVGIYEALRAVESAADSLDILDKSPDFDDVRKEKSKALFHALDFFHRMETIQRSKGLLSVFSWENNPPKDTTP